MKCTICGRNERLKKDMINHIENAHADDIPENMSAAQFLYSMNHGGRTHGLCRVCKKPTPWSEEAGKPKQLCGRKACTDAKYKEAAKNIESVHGDAHPARFDSHQVKMLANRSISGTYTWSDGTVKEYVGKNELRALEALDKLLGLSSDQVICPGITLRYYADIPSEIDEDEFDRIMSTDNGELYREAVTNTDGNHREYIWITDIYLPDYNLIIEVKDGGSNKNNHPGFRPNRVREKYKDAMMANQTKYNYLKLTDNNTMQLIRALAEIRVNNVYGQKNNRSRQKPMIYINEATVANVENDLYETVLPPKLLLVELKSPNGATRWAYSFDLMLIHIMIKDDDGKLVMSTLDYTAYDESLTLYTFSGPQYILDTIVTTYTPEQMEGVELDEETEVIDLVYNMIEAVSCNKSHDFSKDFVKVCYEPVASEYLYSRVTTAVNY